MTPKELLDWVLAEATHPHGPKLITPGEIYADMARKLLAVVIDGEPISPDSGPTFVAELRPGGHYLVSLDKHVTAEQADKMRLQRAAIFPGMTFGLGQGLKAVTREEAFPADFNVPRCPTCGGTGEPLRTNGDTGVLCENPWHRKKRCDCGLAVNIQREAHGPHHRTSCPKWSRFGPGNPPPEDA